MRAFAVAMMLMTSMTAEAHLPSAKDILTWIAGHFEPVSWSRSSTSEQRANDAQLDFDGCQVTLTLTATITPDPSGGGYSLIDTRVHGPFRLNAVRPDVFAGGPR